MKDLTIPAIDGYPLAASVFEPADRKPAATVVLNSATAVLRRFYRGFGEYLAGSGLRVVSFDYRGIGGSRPATLRGFECSMTQWAELDSEGVVAYVRERFSRSPLLLVGHSFGGQGLGLLPSATTVQGAVLVATQSGFYGHWPFPGRLKFWFFTHVLLPALSRLFGFFPAKALRFSEDMPAGVAREWASWCRHPDYLLRVPGRSRIYADLSLPLFALSFSDDAYAPLASVEDLLSRFSGAALEHRHLEPRDAGDQPIGHFGFFRRRFADRLWPLAGDRLLGWAATS